MLNRYYDNIIKLSNGAWIGCRNSKYDFGYKNHIIIERCSNFSYITEKIVCFKKENKIFVYSMKIVRKYGSETAEKLLEFIAHSNVAYGKIICERNTYLIDGNCQIKFSEKSHIN